MDIVDQLLTGSGKLNLIQSDITKIIKMVVHQLTGSICQVYVRTGLGAEIYVRWLVNDTEGKRYLELRVEDTIYKDDQIFSLRAEHIRPARDLLNDFVVDLLANYPQLKAKLEPILTA